MSNKLIPAAFALMLVLVLVLNQQRQQANLLVEDLAGRITQLTGGDTAENRAKAAEVLEKARKLIEIPEDTKPTVATIVDVEKLRGKNAFYNKAQNGDHLILTAKRAVLYRESTNKIIDVVPVQIQQAPASAPSKQQQ